MTLLSYLSHGGNKYKLFQNGASLTLEVESSSGQTATTTIENVDCSLFIPKLDPLSKENTAQVAVSYKSTSGQFKTSVYSYNSSGTTSLTEQGSGYTHTGTLRNIGACGSVNREKLCAVSEESGVTKSKVLSVDSSGSISDSEKTIQNLNNSTVVSMAEGNAGRVVVLAKDGDSLKKGDSTSSSVSMSAFNPTGGINATTVDNVLLNACKENKVSAITTSSDGKMHYIKANGNTVSTNAEEITANLGPVKEVRVAPTYDSGTTVSKFNVFVTNPAGGVKKVSFDVSGANCQKTPGSTVTVTDESPAASSHATSTPIAQTTSKKALTTSKASTPIAQTTSKKALTTSKATTPTTAKTSSSVSVRSKATTGTARGSTTRHSSRQTSRSSTSSSRQQTRVANTTFYLPNTTAPAGTFTPAITHSSSNGNGAVVALSLVGGIFSIVGFFFIIVVLLVYRRRHRARTGALRTALGALSMEALNPAGAEEEGEVSSVLESTGLVEGAEGAGNHETQL